MTDAAEAQRLIQRMWSEHAAYRAALEQIARQDYRGPRPHEQLIAERALERTTKTSARDTPLRIDDGIGL